MAGWACLGAFHTALSLTIYRSPSPIMHTRLWTLGNTHQRTQYLLNKCLIQGTKEVPTGSGSPQWKLPRAPVTQDTVVYVEFLMLCSGQALYYRPEEPVCHNQEMLRKKTRSLESEGTLSSASAFVSSKKYVSLVTSLTPSSDGSS